MHSSMGRENAQNLKLSPSTGSGLSGVRYSAHPLLQQNKLFISYRDPPWNAL